MKDLYNIDDWTDVSCCRLGEILMQAGKINLVHLAMVLDIQKFKSLPMGEIFLSLNVISKEDLTQALLIQETIRKRSSGA